MPPGPAETVVPWGPCDPSGASFTGLADGSYRFDVRARNASDEVSEPAAGWFFRVDTTGPTVAFSTAPLAEHAQRSASFRFEPEELITGSMTCTVDGRAVGCANGRDHVAARRERRTRADRQGDGCGRQHRDDHVRLDGRSAPSRRRHPGLPTEAVEGARSRRSTCGRAKDRASSGAASTAASRCRASARRTSTDLKEGRHTLKVWSVDLAYNQLDPHHLRLEDRPHRARPEPAGRPDRRLVHGSGEVTFNVSQSEKGQLWCSLDAGRVHDVQVAGPLRGSAERRAHVRGLRGRRSRQPVAHRRARLDVT